MKLKGALCRHARYLLLAAACHGALAANPQAEALLEQGDAAVKALDSPKALALFDKAESADPNDVQIVLRVSQQCSDMIARAKSPEEALEFARRSLGQAKRAVQIAPDNEKAHLALAVAYGRLTSIEDNRTRVADSRLVKEEVDKALKLDPMDDFAFHVLGRWNYGVATLNPVMKVLVRYIYGGMPDASLEEAGRDYKKAIQIAPQRVIHHHELARVYVAMGKPDLARAEWEKELTLKPEDTEGINDQKEAREELGKP